MQSSPTQSRGRVKGGTPLWGQGATPLGSLPLLCILPRAADGGEDVAVGVAQGHGGAGDNVGGAGAVVVGEGFPAGAISVGRRIFRQRTAVLGGKVPPKPRLYLVHRHADHHVLIGVHLLAP